MDTILIAGAGKSSTYLIDYLLFHAPKNKWNVIIADSSETAINEKIKNLNFATTEVFDINDKAKRQELVKKADIVVSLMPPDLHILLAKDCLEFKKNLITSSYISDELRELAPAIKEAGIMFMCEMGLDPGIDHMTANQIIDSIQRVTGVITSFKSYCGGLVAPECDDNPWHYKFTWNPKNVVNAGGDGHDTAQYLLNGKKIIVGNNKVFDNAKRTDIAGIGSLAWYPNRNSLKYLELYDVPEIKTFIRATLRHPDFCKGWQALIDLGLTAKDDKLDNKGLTNAKWIAGKTEYNNGVTLSQHVANKLNITADNKIMKMLQWLDLFEGKEINNKAVSSADALLNILQEKWALKAEEKDMVVMQHEVEYEHRNTSHKLCSTLIVKGENREHSAMAKTVGLPIAVFTCMILKGKIAPPKGLSIPNMPSVYRPVLNELKHHNIQFTEQLS